MKVSENAGISGILKYFLTAQELKNVLKVRQSSQ